MLALSQTVLSESGRSHRLATARVWPGCYPVWSSVPYLSIGGPLSSGKTTLFKVLVRLCFRPLESSNLTAACLFHTFHGWGGTLLLDEGERLRDGSPEASEVRSVLLTTEQRLAGNTVRRRIGVSRQFLRMAVRRKLIPDNPFDGLPAAVRGDPAKFRFVTREEADRIIEACPDAQWRLLFALSRYGGLRCPSEHLALKWCDVDWARSRIRVSSPKTAHHPGGDFRVIPLFPELLPHLRDVFEQADPGAEYVITRYRETTQNLRTEFARIIRRAGLEPWPKLFQNLRATRETELAQQWALHVVTKWIGNSQPVALKHYLEVTDEDYEKAVQNPVQHVHPPTRITPHGVSSQSEKVLNCSDLRDAATQCANPNKHRMGLEGFEPPTKRL